MTVPGPQVTDQGVQAARLLFAGANVPFAQPVVEHTGAVVAVPTVEAGKPAGQPAYVVQLVAFVVVLRVSGAHAVQTWFAMLLPGVDTYWPGVQGVNGVQAAALLTAVVNVPVAQAAHTSFEEVLPTVAAYWPARH